MASYKVTSDLIDGKNAGDTISDDELQGCNIDALLAAGHLAETTTKKTEKE
jgi:hypothetical protein